MGTMLLVIVGSLFFSLTVFIACEEMSLKNANFSDMKGLFTAELKVSECLDEFKTVRYMVLFLVILFAFDLALANLVFVPSAFGTLEMIVYVFVPSLLGSWVILLVKWTYQPIVKLASSFMYGAGFIGAAALAFGVTNFVLV